MNLNYSFLYLSFFNFIKVFLFEITIEFVLLIQIYIYINLIESLVHDICNDIKPGSLSLTSEIAPVGNSIPSLIGIDGTRATFRGDNSPRTNCAKENKLVGLSADSILINR